jgi:hypothetical protein
MPKRKRPNEKDKKNNELSIYEEFYCPKDTPAVPIEFIESFYPIFFCGKGKIQFKKITMALKEKKKDDKQLHQAKEVIKNVFRFANTFVYNKTISNIYIFQQLSKKYGANLAAHGVEESKGGLVNILLICISGSVTVNNSNWGKLQDGPPNISPIPHGPYFIISKNKEITKQQTIKDISKILLPCQENVKQFKEKLQEAQDAELITQEINDECTKKTTSVTEFFNALEALNQKKIATAQQTLTNQ